MRGNPGYWDAPNAMGTSARRWVVRVVPLHDVRTTPAQVQKRQQAAGTNLQHGVDGLDQSQACSRQLILQHLQTGVLGLGLRVDLSHSGHLGSRVNSGSCAGGRMGVGWGVRSNKELLEGTGHTMQQRG